MYGGRGETRQSTICFVFLLYSASVQRACFCMYTNAMQKKGFTDVLKAEWEIKTVI